MQANHEDYYYAVQVFKVFVGIAVAVEQKHEELAVGVPVKKVVSIINKGVDFLGDMHSVTKDDFITESDSIVDEISEVLGIVAFTTNYADKEVLNVGEIDFREVFEADREGVPYLPY